MTAAGDQDIGKGSKDVYVPSPPKNKSLIVKGDDDDLFENCDAQKLLINWSGSFDAFGSSQGVRFPITWVNLNEVDVDA